MQSIQLTNSCVVISPSPSESIAAKMSSACGAASPCGASASAARSAARLMTPSLAVSMAWNRARAPIGPLQPYREEGALNAAFTRCN